MMHWYGEEIIGIVKMMKNNTIMLVAIILIGFGVYHFPFYFLGTKRINNAPNDFKMIFKYGVQQKNELNTFNGVYTKDMILDPSITAALSLSQEELDNIYNKMIEINFFDYPDKFSFKQVVIPYSRYYFKVQHNGQIKELSWDEKIVLDDKRADKLRELISYIMNVIQSKEEYKNLPPAKGGYE